MAIEVWWVQVTLNSFYKNSFCSRNKTYEYCSPHLCCDKTYTTYISFLAFCISLSLSSRGVPTKIHLFCMRFINIFSADLNSDTNKYCVTLILALLLTFVIEPSSCSNNPFPIWVWCNRFLDESNEISAIITLALFQLGLELVECIV